MLEIYVQLLIFAIFVFGEKNYSLQVCKLINVMKDG